MRPGFKGFLLKLRTVAVAGLVGWAFAETAAVGWLGVGWGIVAAGLVVQAMRLRSMAVTLWTLAGVAVLSAVGFGVPVASSAGRAAAIAALTSAPVSSTFIAWMTVVGIISIAVAVHDGIIVKLATLGAAGLDRLGLLGEGDRFGLLSGAAALFGITLVETWPGGTETRLIAASIPLVACGAIAMGEGLIGGLWKRMNRAAGGRPQSELYDRPLAAPRVTHEMTDRVAQKAGLHGRDVVVENFVPDDQSLGVGEQSVSPPIDYERMAAMVAPRRRVEVMERAPTENGQRSTSDVIEAARNPISPTTSLKVEERKPVEQAAEVGPLDLWDDDEVAEWETGVSSGQLEAMKNYMSEEEIDEYAKGVLSAVKAQREREEHLQIVGLPDVPQTAPDEAPLGQDGEPDNEAFQLVDLFVQATGPLAEAPYRIIERFRAAPHLLARVVELEPRAQAFVDAIQDGRSESELEVLLMTPAGDAPDVVEIAEVSEPVVAKTAAPGPAPEPENVPEQAPQAAEETTVRDDVIDAAAAEAASSYRAVEGQLKVFEAEAVGRPFAGFAEKFTGLQADFNAVLHAQRKSVDDGGADLDGLLVSDLAMVRQFGADMTLVKALLAFSGNDMSYYVVRTAIEMLVRRMPTEATDPMCGVLMQVLRDLPVEAFGSGPDALEARRRAEARLALVVLRDRMDELVSFCRSFAAGQIDDRDAFEAATTSQSLYFLVADINPAYAALPDGKAAPAAFEAALSAVREVVALREVMPSAEVLERERSSVMTDENQRRGMAAALRRLMSESARAAIDDLRDVAQSALLLHDYLWRHGQLPQVEAHKLYPALTLIIEQMVRAGDVAREQAKDSRNLEAILKGFDSKLREFLDEHSSAAGREALKRRIEKFVDRPQISDIEPLLNELRERATERDADLEKAHRDLEFEVSRGPVERACDALAAMLEANSVTVQLVDSSSSSPACMFYCGPDGDVAFIVIDGLRARWRLLNSELECEQFGLSFSFERACAMMPRTKNIGRSGSFRLVLANCAGLETAQEPGIARIEDIVGADDASRLRAAQFLKAGSALAVWK